MIIDMHIHPIFYEAVCKDKEELEFRKNAFGVFNSLHTDMMKCLQRWITPMWTKRRCCL